MKISCIIVTHNRLELLRRSVQSVINQTYKDLEIIVVDDASEDGTEEYGQKLISDGINYIRINKEDSKGGGYARNIGIGVSTGEYVAFLDDDDYWLPRKIEKQVDYAIKHPSVGMIYSGFGYEFDCLLFNYKKLPSSNFRGDLIEKELITQPFVSTITMMVKREILEEIGGFDINMKFWQEYELSLRIIQVTTIGFVPNVLSIANRRGSVKRLTSQFRNFIENSQYLYKKHSYLFDKLSEDGKKRKEEYFYREAAYRASVTGDKKNMKYFYAMANKINPKLEYKIRILLGLSKDNTILFESLIMKIVYLYRTCLYRIRNLDM